MKIHSETYLLQLAVTSSLAYTFKIYDKITDCEHATSSYVCKLLYQDFLAVSMHVHMPRNDKSENHSLYIKYKQAGQ